MSATRIVDGVELPAAGVWRLDPGHSDIGFIALHLGLSKVRGRFTRTDGTITIGQDPADSTVQMTIDMASVTSGYAHRDDHLRSSDFFDVERHPTATFRSDVVVVAGRSGMLYGELTLKGTTRPLDLEVEYLGHALDPCGRDRAAFSAHARINREDWGLTWNRVLSGGGLLASKEIRLEIDVELIRQQ